MSRSRTKVWTNTADKQYWNQPFNPLRLGMTDFINVTMLVCAAIGSMAFGVLAAYGIFKVGFALMRPRTAPAIAVKPQPEAAL
jgi:hypothetical protein